MNEPVTLLIPNYNGGRFLRETLTALLRQTFANFTLMVHDNCSTDDSVAIVRSFTDPRVRLVQAPDHVRITANFNRAIALVKTEFFATCSHDEVYEPEWLEVMLGLLRRQPSAFFACCKADSADEAGRVYLAGPERYKGSFWPRAEPCVFEGPRHIADLMTASYLILTTGVFRTDLFRHIGPIDEQYQFISDWKLWILGLLAGYSVIGTHRRLVHYRRHKYMTTHVLTADFTRFREELEFIRWIAKTGYERGVFPHARPDYSLVRNTLLSEFAGRLAAGQFTDAATLLAFGADNIPQFRGSLAHRLARLASRFGRLGGETLKAMETSYLYLRTTLKGT